MTYKCFIQESKPDALLADLLDEVQEYAQVYLLAKERQKGCNSMAQLVVLKEEFENAIGRLFRSCQEKNCPLCMHETYDLDSIAVFFTNTKEK